MAKNFVQVGNTVTMTAPSGGVDSGQGVLIGNLFGVASGAADQGDEFELATEGVFELPKKTTDVIGQGAAVYWDTTPGEVTTTGPTNYPIGAAIVAAGNGATIVRVRLDGVATAAVPSE